jgi:hypothetical protein
MTMEHKTWTTTDKSTWGDGPWQQEPDKEQFTDEVTGLPCLIKRNHFGALCGYVGVAEGHPWFGKGYDDVGADVHGGLTYDGFCQEGDDEAHTICHVPGPGEPDRVWWLGFDAGHAWDISPGMVAHLKGSGGGGVGNGEFGETYRTIAYMKAECASLAEQAQAAQVPAASEHVHLI